MGQKINPIGFRLAVNRNWSSKWYANSRTFAPMLAEDIKVRDFLKRKLAHASVGRVLIERPAKDARITIFSARPGVVIGKKGEEIESLKAELRRIMGVQQVHVNIEEIRKPEIDAQLIADSIAQQLEKRIMFRRAMKRAMQNAMRLGAQGIKIMSAGRLNGIEIARTEWYREGRVPLHTLRADIDYGLGEAKTNYGVIGIKVWVYKGEVIPKGETALLPAPATAPLPQPEAPAEPKRARKPFPKAGAKRAPARPRADADKKPAKKDAAPPAPKTVVKKAKKIVKDEAEKKDEGEKKDEKGS
ncbi:MAG TPA: 30S ribosomal protein S3 [Burkholderiales bacterium]|nr:30S ribosomal protein S3 [Burkholderiales bacterium]